MGFRADPDEAAKRKRPCSCRESNPSHPTPSSVTIQTELVFKIRLPRIYKTKPFLLNITCSVIRNLVKCKIMAGRKFHWTLDVTISVSSFNGL
jgi:hypothetical protein